jgi:hypothetical protein
VARIVPGSAKGPQDAAEEKPFFEAGSNALEGPAPETPCDVDTRLQARSRSTIDPVAAWQAPGVGDIYPSWVAGFDVSDEAELLELVDYTTDKAISL